MCCWSMGTALLWVCSVCTITGEAPGSILPLVKKHFSGSRTHQQPVLRQIPQGSAGMAQSCPKASTRSLTVCIQSLQSAYKISLIQLLLLKGQIARAGKLSPAHGEPGQAAMGSRQASSSGSSSQARMEVMVEGECEWRSQRTLAVKVENIRMTLLGPTPVWLPRSELNIR